MRPATRSPEIAARLPNSVIAVSLESERHLEGELLERDREVDVDHRRPHAHIEPTRGEVEETDDPRVDQALGRLLGGLRRHRQDADPDRPLAHERLEVRKRPDAMACDERPDDRRVSVEDRHDVEALASEAPVRHERAADVAGAHDAGVPLTVLAEDQAQPLDELRDRIADARATELAEEGEVLAHLGVGDAEGMAKLLRGDRALAVVGSRAELAQVEAQSPNRRIRNPRGRLARSARWHRAASYFVGIGRLETTRYHPAVHIHDVFARDSTTFSFEFFPPRTDPGWEALFGTIADFERLGPSFVSVTYGAGGSTRQRTHDLVVRLKERTTLDPIPHLTCVGHSAADIDAILARYAAAGVSNILALRGDLPKDAAVASAREDFAFAADLVASIRRFNASGRHPDPRGFGIGVAGFPEGHPRTPNRLVQMDHLKAKVDAGADYIVTQLFFDNRAFFDFVERARLAGIEAPILAGIMPVTSIDGLKRMAELAAGTNIPAPLLKAVARCGGDADAVARVGIHWASEQCRDLLDRGVRGIHFYTLNRSDATRRIYETLGVMHAGRADRAAS